MASYAEAPEDEPSPEPSADEQRKAADAIRRCYMEANPEKVASGAVEVLLRKRRPARSGGSRPGSSVDGSRRRRGLDLDSPWRQVAATPRPRPGYSVETSRADAAAAT